MHHNKANSRNINPINAPRITRNHNINPPHAQPTPHSHRIKAVEMADTVPHEIPVRLVATEGACLPVAAFLLLHVAVVVAVASALLPAAHPVVVTPQVLAANTSHCTYRIIK